MVRNPATTTTTCRCGALQCLCGGVWKWHKQGGSSNKNNNSKTPKLALSHSNTVFGHEANTTSLFHTSFFLCALQILLALSFIQTLAHTLTHTSSTMNEGNRPVFVIVDGRRKRALCSRTPTKNEDFIIGIRVTRRRLQRRGHSVWMRKDLTKCVRARTGNVYGEEAHSTLDNTRWWCDDDRGRHTFDSSQQSSQTFTTTKRAIHTHTPMYTLALQWWWWWWRRIALYPKWRLQHHTANNHHTHLVYTHTHTHYHRVWRMWAVMTRDKHTDRHHHHYSVLSAPPFVRWLDKQTQHIFVSLIIGFGAGSMTAYTEHTHTQ